MSMAPHIPVAAIARLVRVCYTRLWRILDHHVGCAREREDFAYVTAIASDEPSRRQGHRFVSVMADVKKRRVLFATEGKGQNFIEQFVADFQAQCGTAHTITQHSMDMSPACIASVHAVTHETSHAYGMVQGLRTFFDVPVSLAEPYLQNWYHWTHSS